ANIEWARRGIAELQRFSTGGIYLNFPGFGEEREEMLRSAYGDNYARLAELKARYDPGNLFRTLGR
ncbi:MAG: FAD-linked oxidase, partial [Chloroflexi bacterium]